MATALMWVWNSPGLKENKRAGRRKCPHEKDV